MASRKDYYDILGVRRGATEEEIEKAYLKLARTYQSTLHPGNKTAEFRFKEISEAYEILSNTARRERYDRMGIELPPGDFLGQEGFEGVEEEEEGGFEGFEDVLERSLESLQPTVAQAPQKGKDLHCPLEIDFESTVKGTVKEVEFLQEIPCIPCGGKGFNPQGPQRICDRCGGAGQVQIGIPPLAFSQACGRCRGEGKVRIQECEVCSGKGWVSQRKVISLPIPPGVNDRCQIFLAHLGQMGKNGGPRGDLVAEVRVQKHPYFQRRGNDLYIEVPLTLWEAALGVEVEVPTLNGSMKVKVPPGVQPEEQLRLPGQGVPHLQGGGRGDQIMILKIVVPRKIDATSKKILEELKRRNPADPRRGCGWRWKS